MFHVDIMPIVTCFILTSQHFYTFSWTNLLTRCHSASSCFLLFSVSEKYLRKYSRNWTKIDRRYYFTETIMETEGEPERRPHQGSVRPHLWLVRFYISCFYTYLPRYMFNTLCLARREACQPSWNVGDKEVCVLCASPAWTFLSFCIPTGSLNLGS